MTTVSPSSMRDDRTPLTTHEKGSRSEASRVGDLCGQRDDVPLRNEATRNTHKGRMPAVPVDTEGRVCGAVVRLAADTGWALPAARVGRDPDPLAHAVARATSIPPAQSHPRTRGPARCAVRHCSLRWPLRTIFTSVPQMDAARIRKRISSRSITGRAISSIENAAPLRVSRSQHRHRFGHGRPAPSASRCRSHTHSHS